MKKPTLQLSLEAHSDDPTASEPKYYPVLHLGDTSEPPVLSETLIDLEAPQGTTDTEPAKVTLGIAVDPTKLAALSIKRNSVVLAEWVAGEDMLLWTISESEGVMAKDYGITFTLQFSVSDDKDAEDGDWQWANGIWTLDPIVRIRRASYSVRSS